MNKHIDAKILEKYVLNVEEIDASELKAIDEHLNSCNYCKQYVEKLEEFYAELNEELSAGPTTRDKEIAEKFLSKKGINLPVRRTALQERVEEAISTFAEIIEPYPRSLPEKIINYIKEKPIKVISGFSIAAALIILSLSVFVPAKDKNPEYAQMKNGRLTVYNKYDKELWRKKIGTGYDFDFLKSNNEHMQFDIEDLLNVVDVDGDGMNEIITIYPGIGRHNLINFVDCYNADGSLRWRFDFHRKMTFGKEKFEDKFQTVSILVDDFDNDGKVDLIAIYSLQDYPSALVSIDPNTGRFLSEYWHIGSIIKLRSYDIDNDGIKEIFAGGCNNAYIMASIAVLDIRNFKGHSPATEPYTPIGVEPGTEKYYLLIPRSDVSQYINELRSRVKTFLFHSDGVRVNSFESERAEDQYFLVFHFDNNLRCTKVSDSDPFIVMYRKFKSEGKQLKPLNEQYWEDLRRGVKYWDGEKFVSYPTMNKRYLELNKNLSSSENKQVK